MADSSQILEHLHLGSKRAARSRDALRERGITHILNLTPPRTVDPVAGVPNFFKTDPTLTCVVIVSRCIHLCAAWRPCAMLKRAVGARRYRRCAMFDSHGEDLTPFLEGCIAFIEEGRHHGERPRSCQTEDSVVTAT